MRVAGIWLLSIVAPLLLVDTTATGYAASNNREYVEDVEGKLVRALLHLSNENFRQAGGRQFEFVRRDNPETFPLQLNTSNVYAVIVACDQNCSYVLATLRDDQNRVLVHSTEQSHTIIINGTPQHSTRHTLQVAVPGCREEACHVGLILLHQPIENTASSVYAAKPTEPTPSPASISENTIIFEIVGAPKVNLRAEPNGQAAILQEIPQDAANLTGTGRSSKNGSDVWVELSHNGSTGWVNSRFLKARQSSRIIYKIVGAPKVNLRAEPKGQAAILQEIPQDAANLTGTGRSSKNGSDVWVELSHNGSTGWVNSRFLARP
jgi:uncharacterized protein YraI